MAKNIQSEDIKLLVLATRWPPSTTPRSVQNHRLLKGTSFENGILVIPHPLNHVETTPFKNFRILHAFNPKKNFFIRICDKIGITFNIPDVYIFWSIASYFKYRKLLKEYDPDIIVSFSKFDSTHLLGYWLKKFLKKPWIVFFSDPWTDLEKYGYIKYSLKQIRQLNEKLEQKVLKRADTVIVTNKFTKDLFLKRISPEKIQILPQAFDYNGQLKLKTEATSERNLTIRYLGNFYGTRTPQPLIEALESIKSQNKEIYDNLNIEIYGKINGVNRKEILEKISQTKAINYFGPIDYNKSIELAKSADLLLLIDAPTDISPFLPSKLIEYIGADRPVIGITPPGAAHDLIQKINGLSAPPNNKEKIIQILVNAHNKWKRGNLDSIKPDPKIRLSYTLSAVSKKFNTIVLQTLKSQSQD